VLPVHACFPARFAGVDRISVEPSLLGSGTTEVAGGAAEQAPLYGLRCPDRWSVHPRSRGRFVVEPSLLGSGSTRSTAGAAEQAPLYDTLVRRTEFCRTLAEGETNLIRTPGRSPAHAKTTRPSRCAFRVRAGTSSPASRRRNPSASRSHRSRGGRAQ